MSIKIEIQGIALTRSVLVDGKPLAPTEPNKLDWGYDCIGSKLLTTLLMQHIDTIVPNIPYNSFHTIVTETLPLGNFHISIDLDKMHRWLVTEEVVIPKLASSLINFIVSKTEFSAIVYFPYYKNLKSGKYDKNTIEYKILSELNKEDYQLLRDTIENVTKSPTEIPNVMSNAELLYEESSDSFIYSNGLGKEHGTGHKISDYEY